MRMRWCEWQYSKARERHTMNDTGLRHTQRHFEAADQSVASWWISLARRERQTDDDGDGVSKTINPIFISIYPLPHYFSILGCTLTFPWRILLLPPILPSPFAFFVILTPPLLTTSLLISLQTFINECVYREGKKDRRRGEGAREGSASFILINDLPAPPQIRSKINTR